MLKNMIKEHGSKRQPSSLGESRGYFIKDEVGCAVFDTHVCIRYESFAIVMKLNMCTDYNI